MQPMVDRQFDKIVDKINKNDIGTFQVDGV
jgi:hypothetical protein